MQTAETGRQLAMRMSELAALWAENPQLEKDYWDQFHKDYEQRREPRGFVQLRGHLQYRQVMSGPMRSWRAATLTTMSCEIDPRHRVPRGPGYLFDHCHEHGWVRAVVCPSCNVKLGQLDAARKLAGVTVVLGNTGFGRIVAKCPYCEPDHARHGCPPRDLSQS